MEDFSMPFFKAIKDFNTMYKLPGGEGVDTLDLNTIEGRFRVHNFQDILQEEVKEGDDVTRAATTGEIPEKLQFLLDEGYSAEQIAKVMLADWLGDVVVYAVSEMERYGLQPKLILECIMKSNATKMGADGLPVYDERGKVLKGPGYVAPEAMLAMSMFRFNGAFAEALETQIKEN